MNQHPLDDSGHHVRAIAETGSLSVAPFGFVPCGRHHVPDRTCILVDGHDEVRPTLEPDVVRQIASVLAPHQRVDLFYSDGSPAGHECAVCDNGASNYTLRDHEAHLVAVIGRAFA